MLELRTAADHIPLLLIALVAGAFGGLIADLMLVHDKESGRFELPQRAGRFFDLGTVATILVGAAAAIVAIYIFPPETITREVGETTETFTRYEIWKLVPISVLVGTAGGSFLAAAQSRAMAAAKEQQVRDLHSVAEQELTEIENALERVPADPIGGVAAAAGSPRDDLITRIEGSRRTIRAVATRE